MQETIKNYKDLQVWQKSVVFITEIYNITKKFPKEEIFGLINQMRRSAVSVPSNIAEGWMRQYTKEYVQFIYHALGSCGELETQLIIAYNLQYIDDNQKFFLLEELTVVIKMLHALLKGLRK
ncbi:MAG: four helix bundle protein [Candidatus Omnitrophica bacterium]|nr:four helix bundle protein [Candidatus Omnitrophota bacterium]